MDIKFLPLDHAGGSYIYRVHSRKIEQLCSGELIALRKCLENLFLNCPNHLFQTQKGPRGSALKFVLPTRLMPASGHEVCNLAAHGLEVNKFRTESNHSKVQLFMLEHDSNTIAMEVPLWMEYHEHEDFLQLFRTIQPLTGHIDVLRVEDGKIWIWDYKPNARKEKYAATQVYMYALMLSKRTNIPLSLFRGGYFDSNDAYVFNPEEVILPKQESLLPLPRM